MYRVVKQISFSYGHRLLDYEGKCAHLHGHNAVVEIELAGPELDERGILVDFGDVAAALHDFVRRNLDHRMLLRDDDPLADLLESRGEPVYRMSGNPTAENLARLLFEEARRRGLPVERVRFWETPRSCAEYEG